MIKSVFAKNALSEKKKWKRRFGATIVVYGRTRNPSLLSTDRIGVSGPVSAIIVKSGGDVVESVATI
jgi:hypothetical protein